jgi:uncharacterized protein (TIGR00369 family)
MEIEEHFRKLERMYQGAPTNEYFQPSLKVSDGEAEITIPVRRDFFHAANATHGAVYFKALDDAAFFAVNSLVQDYFVLTVSFTIYITRPISSGALRAHGRVVHRSKRLYLAEAEVWDDRDRVIARGNGSFMRSSIPLDSAVGYV